MVSVGLEPGVVGILEPKGLMAVGFWQLVFVRKETHVLAILQHPPPRRWGLSLGQGWRK